MVIFSRYKNMMTTYYKISYFSFNFDFDWHSTLYSISCLANLGFYFDWKCTFFVNIETTTSLIRMVYYDILCIGFLVVISGLTTVNGYPNNVSSSCDCLVHWRYSSCHFDVTKFYLLLWFFWYYILNFTYQGFDLYICLLFLAFQNFQISIF